MPDVCVVPRNRPVPPVLVEPPLLCVEVLSPEDRLSRLQDRLDEYLALGVPVSWVIDPETRRAWTMTAEGLREVRDGLFRLVQPKVELPLAEVFEDLPPLST